MGLVSKSDDMNEQRRLLLGQEKQQALTHLAFLQRELLAMGDSLQASRLVEANQRLLLTLLSKQGSTENADLAELVNTNQKMRAANEQLVISALHAQDLQDLAEEALIRQKSTLATAAHELRDPLTPIGMLVEQLADMPPEELPRVCDLIKGQVQQMSRLIEDLVDISSTGKLRINQVTTDVVEVINRSAEACIPLMSEKNLSFAAHVPPGPLWVNGDAVRIFQILNNLLTNATKYSHPESRVTLAATVDGSNLNICISDEGIGISPTAIPFIFNLFVRDPRAVELNRKGLGIGLTVVRDLVEAHGGTVTAASEGEGRGSQFVVTFPLMELAHD